MNSTIDLAIRVSPARAATFQRMAARSRAIRLTDDASASAGLVTDDAGTARSAINRACYTLVIDPFCLSAEVRAEFAASGRAMPAHLARFRPSVQKAMHSIDDHRIGEPGLLRIHRWRTADQTHAGALEEELDLAIRIFGAPPTHVFAVERPGYVQAHLGFPGGGMAVIDLDASVPPGNAYDSLSLIGGAGAVYADDHRNRNLLLSDGGTQAIPCGEGDVGLSQLIEDFAIAAQQGRDLSPSWSETDAAIQLAAEVRRAASQQEVIAGGSHG